MDLADKIAHQPILSAFFMRRKRRGIIDPQLRNKVVSDCYLRFIFSFSSANNMARFEFNILPAKAGRLLCA
jgi:hypothetical protein